VQYLQASFVTAKLGFIQPPQRRHSLHDRTLTLPALHTPPTEAAIQASWASETPRNLTELQLQAETIKGLIQRCTHSPPSPTAIALHQLVKGCQMAMQSATLLANENAQLRTENNRQKRRRKATKSYVATGGVLTAAEGLQLPKVEGLMSQSREEAGPSEPKRRAPSKCSMCKSEEYNARTCPYK
jgi:hypothetical protein